MQEYGNNVSVPPRSRGIAGIFCRPKKKDPSGAEIQKKAWETIRMLSHCDSTPSGDRSMTGYVAGLHLKEELLRLEKRQIIDGRKNTAHYRDRPGAGASVRRLFRYILWLWPYLPGGHNRHKAAYRE